ncbi:hypothetical protein ACFT9M_12770 [Micromonospora purpureochromogenes]|uniref:hypothetical protein n=1 Tax=Micromonospora purpureochromogenes TaxID=47872 RepID=UPI0036330A67
MMSAWAWLVSKVERGYGNYVDEYTNDLYCRDWLDKIWPLVRHAVRACWHEELCQLGERFRVVTVDDGGAAVGRYHRTGPWLVVATAAAALRWPPG